MSLVYSSVKAISVHSRCILPRIRGDTQEIHDLCVRVRNMKDASTHNTKWNCSKYIGLNTSNVLTIPIDTDTA